MTKDIDKFYQKRAEELIDHLYDKGYFSAELKRKDMRYVEELMAYMFQSQCESAVKISELTRKVRT